MATTLYPLIYSSGVQRDGTAFQSTYCTDAQWIRFQRDKIKKIGGMKGVLTGNLDRVTNISIFPSPERTEIITVLCHTRGITTINCSENWGRIASNNSLTLPNNNETLWETETVTDISDRVDDPRSPAKSYIVFMKTANGLDINEQITPAQFYRKEIRTLSTGVAEPVFPNGNPINPLINGNLCFAAPYLFLFGANGTVQFSSETNPFDFPAERYFTATSDKIIFGRPIRGGPNVPSLLLWSLSSVIRITNTGPGPDGTPLFKPETISAGSSILSSKCVVEYDGFFFWPGVDRFFVYTGLVNDIENDFNSDYFFDNIDMSRRQQVFGVKNAKYGEIWWFYPVKGVPGANSRAIVFNKKKNFWYDTAISREAGTFSNHLGFMATSGAALVNPNNENYLWRHEFNTAQERVVNGAAITEPIPSYFLAPLFSWAAFPPKLSKQSQPSQLVDRYVDLRRIEPNFVDTDNPSRFEVIVSTKEYAQSQPQTIATVQFDSNTEKLDMRAQGRNMTLKFSSSHKFEVGQIMLSLALGDGR